MPEIASLLTQNIAALTMAGAFLWYLSKKDKENKLIMSDFNNTVKRHLDHALKVEIGLTKALTRLTDCISHLNGYNPKK
jgi:hypothetical protein